MKAVLVAAALLLPTLAFAAAGLTSIVTREARGCAAAWQREDYAAIVASLPARVVQREGGTAAVTRELKTRVAEGRRFGVDSWEAIPGAVSTPKQVGRWTLAVIPVTAIVRSPYAKLTQETQVLALSSDRGKHWSFLPLYDVTQAELNAWFPEFRGAVHVPATPAPRVELPD